MTDKEIFSLEDGKVLIKFARENIEHFLRYSKRIIVPDDLRKKFKDKYGAFVTLNVHNVEGNPLEIETGFGSFPRRFISQPINRNSFRLNFRMVTHYGRHRVKLYRINQEYADLYETRQQDSRDLNEPLTNIQNGLGVFSAFNSDSVFFNVVPE